jgi:hypothetical protein
MDGNIIGVNALFVLNYALVKIEKEAGPVSWAVPFKDGGKQLF